MALVVRIADFILACLACGCRAYASDRMRENHRNPHSKEASISRSALAEFLFATSPVLHGVGRKSLHRFAFPKLNDDKDVKDVKDSKENWSGAAKNRDTRPAGRGRYRYVKEVKDWQKDPITDARTQRRPKEQGSFNEHDYSDPTRYGKYSKTREGRPPNAIEWKDGEYMPYIFGENPTHALPDLNDPYYNQDLASYGSRLGPFDKTYGEPPPGGRAPRTGRHQFTIDPTGAGFTGTERDLDKIALDLEAYDEAKALEEFQRGQAQIEEVGFETVSADKAIELVTFERYIYLDVRCPRELYPDFSHKPKVERYINVPSHPSHFTESDPWIFPCDRNDEQLTEIDADEFCKQVDYALRRLVIFPGLWNSTEDPVSSLPLDKNVGILVASDRRNIRSKLAAAALANAGYTNVKEMKNGFRGWERLAAPRCGIISSWRYDGFRNQKEYYAHPVRHTDVEADLDLATRGARQHYNSDEDHDFSWEERKELW